MKVHHEQGSLRWRRMKRRLLRHHLPLAIVCGVLLIVLYATYTPRITLNRAEPAVDAVQPGAPPSSHGLLVYPPPVKDGASLAGA
jgi:hypothetical protein